MAINKLMRAAIRAITALEPNVKKSYKAERRLEQLTSYLRGKPDDYKMLDKEIKSGGISIPVRIFTPAGAKVSSLLLFFHGGGWVTGGIKNYSGVCAGLAKAAGCVVALVDYRLAPEHKFPAAPEDCYSAAREFFLGNVFDINPDNITLIGDSAGGNLAAAVSLMARDRGEFLPKRQILLYPSTYSDHSSASPYPSVRENGTGYLLTSKRIQNVIDLYLGSDEDYKNPYFAPLLAKDFTNQPRTLIITAEYCPLRDEGEAYGEKLLKAGNKVKTVRMKDALHAYFMLPPSFKLVRQTYTIINDFLSRG